jgi:hypothetical protein
VSSERGSALGTSRVVTPLQLLSGRVKVFRAVVAAAIALVATSFLAGGVQADEESDAQLLIDRYSPVIVVREQPEACGEGEPYLPMAVDPLFDNPEMTLRGPAGEAVAAPGVDDLVSKTDGWYLDIPGSALKPKCTYEQLYDAMDAEPTVYARIATDADRPGQIVLQYWLFYLYNDWNDRHEGDWEMMQLVFPAGDASAALTVDPSVVAFAQHEGGELSDWEGGPLRRLDDTHPMLFAGEGSHASYFTSNRWFGKSAQSGFGCDNTGAPTSATKPTVVVIDNDALPAWLSYEGRWGEKQPSFNNGPTGPNTKSQWTHPVRWVEDEGRRGSVSLPAGGSQVTDLFCSASAAGSIVMFRALDNPFRVISVLLIIFAGLIVLIRRTRWSPVSVSPLATRRHSGQIIRAALRLVRGNAGLFAAIGALIPIAGIVAAVLQRLLLDSTELGDVADIAGRDSFWGGLLVLLLGAAILVPAAAAVTAAATSAVRSLDDAAPPSARNVLVSIRQHPRTIWTSIRLVCVLAVVYATIVLIPLGWFLHSRWAVAVPAAFDEEQPFQRSVVLTDGQRAKSLSLASVATAIAVVLPPLVGTLVLLLSDASFAFVNIIAGLIGLVAVPTAAVIVALLHLDLEARQVGEAITV